ncbi:MAG: glyoxylate reductase [Solirubrobacterales bacterium]|jgi:lactate dehydrogenase-like 2-hydroxyacid dehydrogenase|nr:glyoxylate reductase [Solirubrobacterales bacterium]
MASCFVTRELPGTALERLRAAHEVEVWSEREAPPRADLLAGAAEAEGLLSLLTDPIDAELIEACPRLRVISNYAVGVDNVDVEAATARGIPVGHTPDVLTDSTADLAVALMLAIARRLPEGERIVSAGEWGTWDPASFLGRDLHGATVAIVGRGRIGTAVARRLEGFGCELLLVGRDDPEALPRALAAADFVTLHTPLTPATRGLIGEPELKRMKPTAYLVNTARGPIVDAQALERALREGWIAGAGLDVTDPEPLRADHSLLSAPNLLVIPHLGSATHRTREAMADRAVDNLLAGLAGERLPACVNPEVY